MTLKILFQRLKIAAVAALFGWSSVLIATSPACTHQLTVEEADAAVIASCVLLSRAMIAEHTEQLDPILLDEVLAQVCVPGRTRDFISRVIARGTEKTTTEYLDFLEGTQITPSPSPSSSSFLDAGAP